MAIIYSYPNGSSALASDTLTITRSSIDSPVPNPTFTLTVAQIAAFVQSQLASGTPSYIPVFNTSNTIIDSSMYLDDFAAPTLLTIGNDTAIRGNLLLETGGQDTTITIVSDGSNVDPGGENNNPSIQFIQDGGAQNAAIGFNIIDDTDGGSKPGTGNRFWIVNAMADNVGEGGITFGTAQVDGWDNAIGRFIIRGDGKGLFGHPDSLYSKTLGSQFEIYDNRNDNTTTDASFSVYSVLDVAAPSGNEGAGGIKQILDVYDNGVFSQQEALMLIPGTNASDFAASTPIAFYTNSDMDTSSPTGFAGIIFDSGNWLLDGSGTFTTADPGYQLTVDGSQWLKGALYDGNELPGTAGQVLSSTGTGVEWTSGGTGSIGGGGTLDTIAMFTPDGTTIGDSDITRTGLNAYQINTSLTVPANLTTTNLFANNIFAADAGNVSLNSNVQIGNASTDVLTVSSTTTFNGDVVVDGNFLELQANIKDATGTFPSASGQILVGDSQGSVIWTNPQDVGISGAFREVNEGNGIGIVKTTRNPNNYAPIGDEAFDASHSGSPSSTRGASGAYSVALGENVIASGNNSFAFGKGVRAFADHDIVLGHDTEATGGHSTAIGWESAASGVVSTAIGYFANAGGDNSVAIGWRVDATGSESNVFGKYNLTTDELFVVGNGNNSQRSDLIVGKSNGVILAPSLDISEIVDPKCLITLEYLQQSGGGNVTGTGIPNRLTYWTSASNVAAVSDFEVINSKKLRITQLASDEGIIEGQGDGGVSWIKFGPNPQTPLGGGAIQFDRIVTLGGSGVNGEQNVLTVKTSSESAPGGATDTYDVSIGTSIGVSPGNTRLTGDLKIDANVYDTNSSLPSVNDSVLVGDTLGQLTWKSKSDLNVVEGTGTTNTLPVWTDGPNGVLGDSKVYQDSSNVRMLAGSPNGAKCDYSFGIETFSGQKQGSTFGFEFKTGGQGGGYYKSGNFRFENKLAVGRDTDPAGATLDVGKSTDFSPAAWFRNGVVVSNNPSSVQVDNTSMVIGGGNNDIVSGSDSCLAVGNNNQILSDSDNSLVVGQGNIIRNDSDNCFAIGQGNVIDGTNTGTNSVRSQVLGYDNDLSGSYSSFIAGGNNTVTTGNNAFALGYSHTLQGIDSQFAFGENCTGPASGQNTFMIGSALTGSDKTMAVGFRNDTSSYPAIDYANGLGETKFVVGVGSNATSNAIIITEGGVNRGNPNVEQIPRIILPQQETLEFTSDADATAAGIPTGGLYRNGNDLKINFNETAAGGNEGLAYLTPQLLTASPAGSGTVDPNYNLVLLSWSGVNGVYTLNLPLASANTNRLIRITTDGSLALGAGDKIDITATGGETIDGNPTFQISKQYEGLAVYSTGSEWIIAQAKAH
jgi:hypothetical protein